MSAQAPRDDLPDWGVSEPAPDPAPVGRVAIVVVIVTVIAGVLVLVEPLLAVAWVALAAVALVLVARGASGEGRELLDAPTEPVVPGSRLERLVAGLAADLGIPAPRVLTFDGAPNALVTHDQHGPVMYVSSSLLEGYGLTELEALVAHCLVRVRSGVPGPAWARWVPGWTKRVPACSPASFDVAAASVTRYPPGLASALRKATPRDGRDQGLWFAPRAADACSPSARADALEDL